MLEGHMAMKSRLCRSIIAVILMGGCGSMTKKPDIVSEKKEISKVIHTSIGWAAAKDTTALFNCFPDDSALFWFSTNDQGTIQGFQDFAHLVRNVFMSDDFKAIRFEVRELQINLSQSGDVAWFHCRLDDFNEWQGQPANWDDIRWTGVLEKRNGRWVIVQQHFSEPTGRK